MLAQHSTHTGSSESHVDRNIDQENGNSVSRFETMEAAGMREIRACHRRMIASIAALGLFTVCLTACSSSPVQPETEDEGERIELIQGDSPFPPPSHVDKVNKVRDLVKRSEKPKVGDAGLGSSENLSELQGDPGRVGVRKDAGEEESAGGTSSAGDPLAPGRLLQKIPYKMERGPGYSRALPVDPAIEYDSDL